MTTTKYTFRDGATITGTIEQIKRYASTIGETVNFESTHYQSSTRGLIKISDMDTSHCRNALVKVTKEYFETLAATQKTLSNKEFLLKYVSMTEVPSIKALFEEIKRR